MPRDYKKCMRILREFAEEASPDERAAALELIDQKEGDQEAYYDDRLLQAKYEWEKGDPESRGKSVETLVQLATKLDDPDMVAEATRRLLLIPDVDTRWSGYKKYRPDTYEELLENPEIRARLREVGVE
jgi:hypothetical protein